MNICCLPSSNVCQGVQKLWQEACLCRISGVALGAIASLGVLLGLMAWKGCWLFAGIHLLSPISGVAIGGATIAFGCYMWLSRGEKTVSSQQKKQMLLPDTSPKPLQPSVAKEENEALQDLQSTPSPGSSSSMLPDPSSKPLQPSVAEEENEALPELQSTSTPGSSSPISSSIPSDLAKDLDFLEMPDATLPPPIQREAPAAPLPTISYPQSTSSAKSRLPAPVVSKSSLVLDHRSLAKEFEDKGDFKEACKHYFKLIERLMRKNERAEAELEILNLDKILSHVLNVPKKIQSLSQFRELLRAFSDLYQPARWDPAIRQILQNCPSAKELANQIESYLKSSNDGWQEILTLLPSCLREIRDLNECFPEKKLEGKVPLMRGRAFSEFWKAFSRELSGGNKENLAKDLSTFIILIHKDSQIEREAQQYFLKKMGKLSLPLMERFIAIAESAKWRLDWREREVLDVCFLKQARASGFSANSITNESSDLGFQVFLMTQAGDPRLSAFIESFKNLVESIRSSRFVTADKKRSFKEQWKQCVSLITSRNFSYIYEHKIIQKAVQNLKNKGNSTGCLLIEALEPSQDRFAIIKEPQRSWMNQLYAQARSAY